MKVALATLAPFLVVGACGGHLETSTIGALDRQEDGPALRPAPAETPAFDGTLAGYLAFALEHSPRARAAFERWRAATLHISRARRLPNPNLSFGYFVRSVETRVGPQRFRVGLSQTFPWPTKLSAGSDAAAERAKAAQASFEAEVLSVRRDIAAAYWTLWLVHEEHRLKSEHDAVLDALAQAVRGRVRTGAATLADLSQIELSIARHHDHRGTHHEAGRKASARLLASLGVTGRGQDLAASDSPQAGLPALTSAELRSMAMQHPLIETHSHLAASEEYRAASERADGMPSLRVGIDFIETGAAAMPGVSDSGKDPLIVSAGLSLPLWRGNYSDASRSASAASSAHQADGEAALRRAEAAFEAQLADVRDAQRRIGLYQNTLIPQAQTTFQAVLGGYQSGRSTVAAVILAQRDLLELQIDQARARADHAKALAILEYIVGRALELRGVSQ